MCIINPIFIVKVINLSIAAAPVCFGSLRYPADDQMRVANFSLCDAVDILFSLLHTFHVSLEHFVLCFFLVTTLLGRSPRRNVSRHVQVSAVYINKIHKTPKKKENPEAPHLLNVSKAIHDRLIFLCVDGLRPHKVIKWLVCVSCTINIFPCCAHATPISQSIQVAVAVHFRSYTFLLIIFKSVAI